MAHIFISYAKKDTRPVAVALFRALNAIDGLSAWMDESLEADSSWAGQIQHEIDRADYVIVLLSPDVNRKTQPRSFVLNEIDYAQQDRKPILPVLVQDTKMPVQIAGVQYIDLTDDPSDVMPVVQRVMRRFGIGGVQEEPTPSDGVPVNLRQEFVGIAVLLVIVLVGAAILLSRGGGGATPTQLIGTQATVGVTRNADWTPVEREFDGVTMVLVPAGCFEMGSEFGEDNEKPVHTQCIASAFWLDKTEVTQKEFIRLGGEKHTPNAFLGDDRPVENITWFEAQAFCEKRGGRLPTEAEWEYAARGTDGLIYPWGNEFVPENAIFNDNSDNQTAEVGSRPDGISWVGALDMSGNVWEWTSSLYDIYPYDINDGRENVFQEGGRVLRGGSWFRNSAKLLRATYRSLIDPVSTTDKLGFRCARDFE